MWLEILSVPSADTGPLTGKLRVDDYGFGLVGISGYIDHDLDFEFDSPFGLLGVWIDARVSVDLWGWRRADGTIANVSGTSTCSGSYDCDVCANGPHPYDLWEQPVEFPDLVQQGNRLLFLGPVVPYRTAPMEGGVSWSFQHLQLHGTR